MNSNNQTPSLYALYTVFFVLALCRSLANGGGKHIKTIPPQQIEPYLQMTFANEFVYLLTVSLAQISILCFYLRLFKVNKTFAKIVYGFLVVVACWAIAMFFSTLFQCTPVKLAFAAIPNQSHCIQYRSWLLGTNIPHVIIDFSILCLPLHQIWQLSLSRVQKLGLSSVFLVGTFTSVISVIRTWENASIALDDPTWDYTPVQMWSALEGWVSVICACLPSLAPLMRYTCGGQRFGKHRGTPNQIYNHGHDANPKKINRRKDESTFSKLEEDQAQLFDQVESRSAMASAGHEQRGPIPLHDIRITSDINVRSDLRV
ncbi:MAG: hypothetical protein Q9212_006394 [Teloschistes hypoglaucus]